MGETLQPLALRVNKSLLSDQICEAVRAGILTGELAPGQRLVESELARTLQVSQAPVRDALKQLSHEGLVLQVARRGTFVATVDERDAQRTYALRAELERFAATEFCSYADDDALPQVDTVLDNMRAAARDDDLPRFVECDIAFHRTVWQATEHPLLPRIWPMVEATFRALTVVSNRLYFGNLREIAEMHAPLLDSLRARDPDQAGPLFHDHVTEVWRRIEATRDAEGDQ